MFRRLDHVRRDERGMSMVYVALGFMAFLSATTLAIDVGMFMTARSQAQNSADAGALAGATSFVFNSFTDRTPSGPVVQAAINAALANQVMYGTVSVTPADVTFPLDPSGQANRVKVDVHRTAATGNPIPTLMGKLFGVNQVDINATATGEASPANAIRCPAPFTIPDKWQEHIDENGAADGSWNPDSTFDMYDNHGNLLTNHDVYIPRDQAGYTGYDVNNPNDLGLEITLKSNNGSKITASWYNPWDLPGSVGADDYRANISGCDRATGPMTSAGYQMSPENGNMTGPTAQGMQDLIDQDPTAQWNDACKCVISPKGYSPRIVPIPLYDPVAFAEGKQHGNVVTLITVGYVGFFIEPMVGGEVKGRLTRLLGDWDKNAGPAPPGTFAKTIRLVQ